MSREGDRLQRAKDALKNTLRVGIRATTFKCDK